MVLIKDGVPYSETDPGTLYEAIDPIFITHNYWGTR